MEGNTNRLKKLFPKFGHNSQDRESKRLTSNLLKSFLLLEILLVVVIFGVYFSTKMFTPNKTLASAGWDNPSWGYRKEITIDHTKVSNTDQLNFPILINLTDSSLQTNARSDGFDILFTDSSGITKISYEREQYNSGTGTLVAWVKVTTLSHTTDTVIYMYYGNSGATDQQDTTHATWDSNYKGVWHLKETGSIPPIYDSTSNNNNSMANSTTPTLSGKIDGAATFNGTTSKITFNPAKIFWDYSTPHTFDFWVYINSFSTNHWPTIINCISSGYPFAIFLSDGSGGYSGYDGIGLSTAHNTFRTNDVSGQLIGRWNHIAVTYDGVNRSSMSSLKVYLNGVLQPLRTAGGWDAFNYNYIGTDGVAGDFIDGYLDEPRLSDTVRSADWIQTEYNNQNNPSVFYSLGSETIRDTTPPTVDLIFPTPGPSSTSFQAVFSKDVVKSEAENPANYFLHNWPGAGGSGDLVGDATIIYNIGTKTATINFTNPGWYISPEQQLGVQNIHDLAGNLLAVSPYSEYSTPMVAPVTTSLGINANWHNTPVIVSFNCTDVAGSGCYKTYYSIDSASFTEGTSVVLPTDGQYTVAFYSVDNAGNIENTQTAGQTVNIDTIAPSTPGMSSTTSPTNNNKPTWSWTASTDSGSGLADPTYSVQWCSNSGFMGCDANTSTSNINSFTHSSSLTDGTWYFRVKASDAVGNNSVYSSTGSVLIDTTTPTISNITSAKANGTYGVGVVIDIDLIFSENITSTENVTVTLDTGGSCAFTVTDSSTGSCNYIVGDGENSPDLNVSSVSGLIKDTVGNVMVSFISATNLAVNKDLVIDTAVPSTPGTPAATLPANTTPSTNSTSNTSTNTPPATSATGVNAGPTALQTPTPTETPALFDVTAEPVQSAQQNIILFVVLSVVGLILLMLLAIFVMRRIRAHIVARRIKAEMEIAQTQKVENIPEMINNKIGNQNEITK